MTRTRVMRGGVVAAVAAAVVALTAGVGFAQAGDGPRHARGGFDGPRHEGLLPLGRLAVVLDLTDAQQAQAKAIVDGHKTAMQQLRERGRAARERVRAAVHASTVDEAAIRAAVSQASQVQADAAVLRAKVRQEVFALLTPEQRAKAEQLETMRPRGRGRRN